MKGLIADVNIQGLVEYLVICMQSDAWSEFWHVLGLGLYRFDEIGLLATSSDLEVWNACQAEQLILITDNRNLDSEDSLEATIRRYNSSESLPVFTIADINEFRTQPVYVERVVETLYDYLFRIDTLRGTGRLYLP